MLSFRFELSLATLLLISTSTGAHAQPPSQPAPRDTAIYDVPPVTVRAARPRTTAGGASSVALALDSAVVRPAPTLEQVLRSMPLVVVRANSRGEAQPALRGGEDRQIAVLVDGVPITLAWDHRTDLSVVPLTAAQSVTLHRGLSSLLLGPNALAGAVEVDIARGSRADAAPPPLVVDAGVDHTGAHSAALSVGMLRTNGEGRWIARAGAGYRGSNGAVLPHALERSEPGAYARLTSDGDLRLNTDVEAFDGFFSVRRVSGGGAWTSFTGSGYRLERGVAPEAHTTEPRLWRYPFQARGLGALSAGTGMRDTPWGRGDLEASLGGDFSRSEIDEYDGLDYRTIVGGELADDRTLTARLIGDHSLGSKGDLHLGLTFADVSHEEVIDADPKAQYRQRLWSLASETSWRVERGVPVRLSFGAAADGADTPESSNKPPLDRLWDWAARAGATASFREGRLQVHGSTGRRARFPALRELYSGALGRFLENPDLRAESQWANELGSTWRHRRGEMQLLGFHQSLDDAITRVSVSTPSGNRFQRVNLGRTTAQGAEFVGDVALGALAIGGDGTWQRVRGRDAAGNATELEYEPAFYGRVWAEAPLPGRARIGVEVHGAVEQRFIDIDTGGFSTLSPAMRFDVSFSRAFDLGAAGPWHRVEALLALANLADQPVFDQAGLPQAGRTIRVQARLW
ncbi:MAG TPA: TonB-dependent receptor [Candidatus Limnocylindria bacterium]|nr:TonB-dependent receptor [Candidatus Limnocylindria bacterium]